MRGLVDRRRHQLFINATDGVSGQAGSPLSVERIGGYPRWLLRLLFWKQGLSKELSTSYGISLYRLTYRTHAPDGRLVDASGLIGVPKGCTRFRAVVSWQHGTASLRTAAPSSKDVFNGLLPAAVFAGHGYLLLAPDYLGYGVSEEEHEYYLAENMAAVVVDFIRAARDVLARSDVVIPANLCLSGFSEGAHATLAAQRAIEGSPNPGLAIVASAPVAAAVDLADLGLAGALAGNSRFCSLYVAWLAKSYSHACGEPLTTVLRPDWATIAQVLFDGTHDGESTVAALPPQPRTMLTNDLLNTIDSGGDHWFLRCLRDNSLLDWRPEAPVRAYFGTLDRDVTPEQARLLENTFRAAGADATAVCVGDVDHDTSLARAAPLIRHWFDEVSGARAHRPL